MVRRLAVVLPLLLAGPALAGPSPDGGQVLRGARGELVDVVMLKPAADGNAVLRFAGTGGALDGLALPARRSVDGNHVYLTVSWRGRERSLVQADTRAGERWELYAPPDVRQAHRLTVDEAATKAQRPKDVLGLLEKQQKDGTTARVTLFHRDEEQAEQDEALAESAAAAAKACGYPVAARVDWATVSDDDLKRLAIASYCAPPLTAMAALCGEAPAVAGPALRDRVKTVTCALSGPMKLAVAGGALTWTVNADASNTDEAARRAMEAIEVAPPLSARGEAPPWGDGRTLGQRVTLARTAVCSDGKNHFVVGSPRAPGGAALYYGDRQKLARVQVADLLGPGAFFEPRQFNPTANPSFRGADVRRFSFVEHDADKGTCAVRCGARKTDLAVLPAAEAQALLGAATYSAPLEQQVPHSLSRDDRGNYYYVDTGARPESARRFRLFVGPQGNLKQQPMVNVVADSQGEIFSTKNGELRFLTGPGGSQSTWIKGKVKTRLKPVPIEENWQLIYNDLGVYTGTRRGTPCDDL